MGFLDDIGDAIEKGVEKGAEELGQLADSTLDVVGDGADAIGLDSLGEGLDDLGDDIASATGGNVDEEELGETDDPKELIRGEPAEIGSTARTLKDMARAIDSTGRALRKIDAAEWVGEGADAFNEVYDKQPKLWFDGAEAMTAAAEAMEAWHNEVKTAQGKAADAIEKWKAADAEERRQKTWWNALSGEQQAQTPLVDTWTSMRNEARDILRGARTQRDNGAAVAVSAFAAATEKAPKEPPFTERWMANLSDLRGIREHAELSMAAGLATSFTGLVQFVRQINPTDVYNLTHPAEYAAGLSNLVTGLTVAVADPGATMSAILSDARRNPFEFAGALTGDLLLSVATGGGGGAAKLGISGLKRAAGAGRIGRLAGDAGDLGRRLPDNPAPGTHGSNPQARGNTSAGPAPQPSAGPAPHTNFGHTPDTNPVDAGSRPEPPAPRADTTGGTPSSATSDQPSPQPAAPTQPDFPAPRTEPDLAPAAPTQPDFPAPRTEPDLAPAAPTQPDFPAPRTEPDLAPAAPTQPDFPAPRTEPDLAPAAPTQPDFPAPRTEPDLAPAAPTQPDFPAPRTEPDLAPAAPTQPDFPAPRTEPDLAPAAPTQPDFPAPRTEPDLAPAAPTQPDFPAPRTEPDLAPAAPTQPDFPAPRTEPDLAPAAPTQPDFPAPRTDPDPAPTTRGEPDPFPTHRGDPDPTSAPRTDPAPAPRADPDPPQTRTNPHLEAANPTTHADPPPTTRTEHDSSPNSRSAQDQAPSQHTNPDSPSAARPDANGPTTRTDSDHAPPAHTPDTTPRTNPDSTPQTREDQAHPSTTRPEQSAPTVVPHSPGPHADPGSTPPRTPPDSMPPHKPTPESSSPARASDSPARPHRSLTRAPDPTHQTRTPDNTPTARIPEPTPRGRTPDSTPTARPQPDPAARTRPDSTPSARAAPDSSPTPRPHPTPDNPPTRAHETPPTRTEPDDPAHRPGTRPDHGPDTRTPHHDPDKTPDHGDKRDPEPDDSPKDNNPHERDRDNPTARDRAGDDRNVHDHTRSSGSERDRTPDEKACSKDPVDISTGEFLLPEIDVDLPGVLPLTLRRTHHSNYRFGRWFGPTWSATLDVRLVIEDAGITFLGEDGIMLAYPHAEVGEPAHPLTEGRQWSLTRTETGAYRVWDQRRELIWHFAAEPAMNGLDAQLGNYAVSAITDRHHNRIRFHYDADGVPVEVSHSGGYRVRIASDHGRITGLSLVTNDPDLGELSVPMWEFTYAAGTLVAVTDPAGATTRYTYDAEDRMTSWTDSNGNQMVNTYDESGRVIHQRGSAGILNCDFDYLEFPTGTGRLTQVTDSQGAVTAYGFDRELQLRDLITPDGGRFRYDYNTDRRPLTVTGPDRATSTTYRYNGAGDPTTITRPDGSSIDIEYVWRNRPSTITDADGAVHRREWSDNGDLSAVIDPAGARTEFTYHPTGGLATVVSAGARTTVHTDAAGLPIQYVDPLGGTTHIQRDAAGRPIRIIDAAGSTTHYEWSPAGNLLRRTDPDGHSESWSYDGEGNVLSHTDRAGGVTEYTYGAFDLLRSRTDPDGSLTRFDWDSERRLTAVHNPIGQSWIYEYDKAGRLVAETDYAAATTRYTWDSAGRVATVTPATGTTRYHRHDILGRLTEISTDTGEWIRNTYDPAGRVLSSSTGTGNDPAHTLEFTYSATGLLESERVDDRSPVRHAYDPRSRRIRRTSPTGVDTTWHHDITGRVDRLGIDDHEITFDYNLRGHVTGWRTGEITVTREVTDLGRITQQEVTAFPARLVALDLGQSTRPNPRRLRHDEYDYRPDGYLTAHTTTRPENTPLQRNYTLDTVGRVTTVAHNDRRIEHYTYDPLSNITSAAVESVAVEPPPPSAAPPDSTAAHHDSEISRREYHNNLLIHDGRTRYHYDRAGRLIRKTTAHPSRQPDTWHYRYNGFDQLTDVYTPDYQWWHYTYDALGRRTTKQRLTTTGTVLEQTDYTWDETRLIECTTPETTTHWEYHPDSHTPITQTTDRDTPGREFCAVITDLVGAPTELVDPLTGNTTATATTDLWGHTVWHGTASTPLRFPGQFHDPETGLHYNLHRVYDPDTGRFLTRDPLGLSPAPNPNVYPHNPQVWSDPLGLVEKSCEKTGTPDDDGDRTTPDPDNPAPRDPTPTQPTVHASRLPDTTPATAPDPSTAPSTGRPGTGGSSPNPVSTRPGEQTPFNDSRDRVRDRITPPGRVTNAPLLDPNQSGVRGVLRNDFPLPIPEGELTRIVDGMTESGSPFRDYVYGHPPHQTVVRDYHPRAAEYPKRGGGTFTALRHEQNIIYPPDEAGNVHSVSRSQVGDNVVSTKSINGRHAMTEGVVRHDFAKKDEVDRDADSAESTAATNAGHEGVAPTGTSLQYDGGHASSYRTTLDRGLMNLFAQERDFNRREFRVMENAIADWARSGNGRETRFRIETDPPGVATPERVEVRLKMIDANGNTFRSIPIGFSNHGGTGFSRKELGIRWKEDFQRYTDDHV
ncbi:putative T7SS-secreted protein [Nocardia sp. BMG51109]|uniref:putative T7SS-secreted protein n=1 Tax=Nocardia sp. BMG51109 TaxID=1056816 RepID=UPI00046353D2|nr:DUF6531 domain-containing protein [Nocardia sp. BMG51109]